VVGIVSDERSNSSGRFEAILGPRRKLRNHPRRSAGSHHLPGRSGKHRSLDHRCCSERAQIALRHRSRLPGSHAGNPSKTRESSCRISHMAGQKPKQCGQKPKQCTRPCAQRNPSSGNLVSSSGQLCICYISWRRDHHKMHKPSLIVRYLKRITNLVIAVTNKMRIAKE
jgi:hypothetical protein